MRSILRRIGGPLLAVCFGLLLCEGMLRVLPSPIRYPKIQEFDDPQSLLGVELVPDTVQQVEGACFSATVTTNNLGWRDRERTVERVPGKTRIAVLGDSFMEGTHVEDDETFARQLEQLLGSDRVEVLNFGISSIGTVQEEILYDKVVSQYHPDIVLVAFYSNDVQNNDPVLDGNGTTSRLTFRSSTGALVNTRTAGSFFVVRKWLRIHSALFRLVKTTEGQLRRMIARPAPIDRDAPPTLPPSFGVYGAPQDDDWKRAWRETETALMRLTKRVQDDGATLFVFSIPEVLQLAPDARSLVRSEYATDTPPGFNPRYPHDQLQQIARRHGIKVIDLLPAFLKARDDRKLSFPYFSFSCDGHWNPEGHRLAAETIAPIIESTMLEGPRRHGG